MSEVFPTLVAGNLVAVYGSLRKGKGNHVILGDSTYLGTERIKGFDMFSLGAYPYVMPESDNSIVVEVYEVDSDSTGKSLDRLEGYPSYYDRKLIQTTHGEAWIYFINEYIDGTPFVDGGDWILYTSLGGK